MAYEHITNFILFIIHIVSAKFINMDLIRVNHIIANSAFFQVCSYFKDPLVCIGPVATDQIKNTIEHTAGEKRITGLAFKRPIMH